MDFLSLAATRRCVRAFSPDPVPEEKLRKLVEAAVLAPSGGNRQPWYFYVVTNPGVLAALHEKAYRTPWFGGAKAAIVVCVEPERSAASYGERGRTLYSIQDTAAAIENILLEAAELGLAACWCGAFNEDGARDALALSSNQRPVAILALGNPAGPAPAMPPRRAVDDVTTFLR